MFCPKCGLEYREGFNECAYCHVALVEEMPELTSEYNEDLPSNEEGEFSDGEGELYEDKNESGEEYGSKPYRTAEEQAVEMKSSGLTLLFVSIIGFVFLILCYLGALPISFSGVGAIITYTVMGLLFLVFFVSGVRAVKKVGILEEEAVRENEKTEEISKWFRDNHTAESIDNLINEELASDDSGDKYFDRIKMHYYCCEPAP